MVKMLRDLRRARGMTMKELGEKVGVAESTISQYETGRRDPDFETLLKLAEQFDVSVDYLIRGKIYNGEIAEKMDESIRERFARNLTSIAKLKGITQAEIVKQTGCSSSTVSEWFTGKKFPRPNRMQSLISILGVELSDLTDFEDPANISDEKLMFALFGEIVPEEMLEAVKRYARFILEEEKQ